MTEADWREGGPEEAAEIAAAAIGGGLRDRGAAIAALPGGKSPWPALERLSQMGMPSPGWPAVTLLPSDDRQVPKGDALSNAGPLTALFEPTSAQILELSDAGLSPEEAGASASAKVAARAGGATLDLCWLGMGTDGHVASIFPGPDYRTALSTDALALGVRPDPLPPEAPVARVSLSARAISRARTLMLTIAGEEKAAVLRRALEEGEESSLPAGRVLAMAKTPPIIIWSPS